MQGAYGASVTYPPLTPPKALERPTPNYPVEAIRQRHQGTVIIKTLVGLHGEPQDIRVEKSSGFRELDAAAVAVAQLWKFTPELKYGVPFKAYVSVPFNFNLHNLSGGDDQLPIATSALSGEFVRIELPEGNAYTASLENGNLLPSHHPPFKLGPGQQRFPPLPSDPSGYAQSLETAYHNAYVTAAAHSEPPASRCLMNCMRTIWMAFNDGAVALLNVQDGGSEAILFPRDGLPSTDDARAVATIAVYLHQHPGLEMADWELREKGGAGLKTARLYYYDMPADRALALARMAIAPPPPAPPPPPPPQAGDSLPPAEVCHRTLVKGAEHTVVASAAEIPVVTVVVDRSGQVAHEWIARSSGLKYVDSSALTDASHWTFNGIACDGQRVSESVGIAGQ
ncbi:hypothetical protein GCM10007898_38250 [Dyella flagellata]|uniref:TonB C-terminal domain-containing protein n=1 Tax=Dyella flagellata TaxID=1867833 RepID=A0ABQ5XEY9_9GAMM|nr:hypothetical protein GCM10007898_38250 [Dyella flagellata]